MNKLISFLETIIMFRFSQINKADAKAEKPTFSAEDHIDSSPLKEFISSNALEEKDILILGLALVPCVRSGFLRKIIAEVEKQDGIADFGCIRMNHQNSIFPTLETALFILAGSDMDQRAEAMEFIYSQSFLFRKGIVSLEEGSVNDPSLVKRLIIDEEYLDLITIGKMRKPKLSSSFPAQLIQTSMEWENLVLQPKTLTQIKEIEHWLEHEDMILNHWGMKSKIKPGYRVMFHGLPGTGKTLTAALLGKYTGRDVYRIDLSRVASKYIGETEKNLSNLFDKAANKDWILFFDEADSIFGKRTGVKDAHDKYANQEVSYLLQKIESHAGLVILASNFKSNIDKAFLRRFQCIVEFEKPSSAERLLLWKNNLPVNLPLQDTISLDSIAKNYSLTGSNIVNIVQLVCLKTAAAGEDHISIDNLMEGIKREFAKEERMV